MILPVKAIMREEKFIMIEKKKVIIAAKGTDVTIYNVDHAPVFLCTNSRNETFSVHRDMLTIK